MLLDGVWQPGAVNVIAVRDGKVSQIAGFVDPEVVEQFA